MKNLKDLISDDEAIQIESDSAKAIFLATQGYNKEALKTQFKRKNRRQETLDKNAAKATGEVQVYTPPPPIIMEYDLIKKIFWNHYKRKIGANPILTTNNIEVIKQILTQLLSSKSTPTFVSSVHSVVQNRHLTKGIFIFGDYGRGKTDLIYALKLTANEASTRADNVAKWPHIQDYKQIMSRAMKGQPVDRFFKKEAILIIDDLGFNESSKINNYGNKTDLVENIIYLRHRIWKQNTNHITIITSNLTPERIEEIHGEGVSSRLEEMCNQYFWNGVNFRKQ